MQKDKLLLRLPGSLKAKIAQKASYEQISLNSLVVKAIEVYLGVPNYGDIHEALAKCYEQIAELRTQVRSLASQQLTREGLYPLEQRLRALEKWQQSTLTAAEPSQPRTSELSQYRDSFVTSETKQVENDLPTDASNTVDESGLPVAATLPADENRETPLSPPKIEVGSFISIYKRELTVLENLEVLSIDGDMVEVSHPEMGTWMQNIRTLVDEGCVLVGKLPVVDLSHLVEPGSRMQDPPEGLILECLMEQFAALKFAGYSNPYYAHHELAQQGTTPHEWLIERGWVQYAEDKYWFDARRAPDWSD